MVSVLICYTVSLRVSAERAGVDSLRAQIAADMRDIRALEAELRTRARLPQLQRWNDNVLAMSAPNAKQYVDSPVQLAAFAPNAPAALPQQQPTTQLAVATEPSQMVNPPESQMTTPLHRVAYSVPPRAAVAPAPTVTAAVLVAAVSPKPAKPEAAAPTKTADKAKPAKAEPKPLKPEPKLAKAEVKPAKEPKPSAPTRVAQARRDDPLGELIGEIDRAASVERKSLVKVAMQ